MDAILIKLKEQRKIIDRIQLAIIKSFVIAINLKNDSHTLSVKNSKKKKNGANKQLKGSFWKQ